MCPSSLMFVLDTQGVLVEFMKKYGLDGKIQCRRKQDVSMDARMFVISENQMREFQEYNENYADKVLVLNYPTLTMLLTVKRVSPTR